MEKYIEKIKERINIIEEIVKEDKTKLSSDSHVICYNRWIGELRAYKLVLKELEVRGWKEE